MPTDAEHAQEWTVSKIFNRYHSSLKQKSSLRKHRPPFERVRDPLTTSSKDSRGRERPLQEGEMIERRAGCQDLILPKAADAGIRPHDYVKRKYESPWQSLQKVYELRLNGFIAVAIRKLPSCELVTVKNFVGSDRDEKVKRLQQTPFGSYTGTGPSHYDLVA